jgi:TIR domain
MAHDVFISHSSKDKVYADAVCARLESEGIRCWIAPRDILPGMAWGSAIVEAIENSRLMVLVFSSNANSSPQIEREVERAINKEVTVVPLRIESVIPGKSLEYFLGTPHWLDAVTPPFEQHLEYITQTVKLLLQHDKSGQPVDIPHPPAPPPPPPRVWNPNWNRWVLIGGGAAAAVVLIAFVLWLFLAGAVPHRLAGTWTTTNFVGPDKLQFTLEVATDGGYRYEVLYKESGQARVRNGQIYLQTADGLERAAGPVAPGSNPPIPANMLAAAPSAVWTVIAKFSNAPAQLPQGNPFTIEQAGRPGPGANGRPAIWLWDTAFGRIAWQITYQFDYDGDFTFGARAVDVGRLKATGGNWKANSAVLDVQSRGGYSFVGNDSLVLSGSIRGAVPTSAMGNSLWERAGTTQSAPRLAAAAARSAAPSPVQAAHSPAPSRTGAPAGSAAESPTASATMTPAPAASPSPTAVPAPPIMALDRRFLLSQDSDVYASPDSSSTVVGHVRRRRYIRITGLTGNWLRVRLNNGTVGFIPQEAVE